MKKKNIHDLIEEQEPETKARLYDRVLADLGIENDREQVKSEERTKPQKRVWLPRIAVIAASCAAIVLAIVLPVTLRHGPSLPAERYCQSSDLSNEPIDFNMRDYCIQNDLDCLYLDWYDISYCETYRYFLTEDYNDTVYLYEYMMNLDTGEEIYYYVTDNHTKVDFLETFETSYANDAIYHEIEIKWIYSNKSCSFSFSLADFKYYINIQFPSSDQVLFDIVDNMLATRS